MLRKYFWWVLPLLYISTAQAQKIKIKKDDILLDNTVYGSLKHIKVKGGNNYYEIRNNEGTHLFNGKLVSEESEFFGNAWLINYHIIECIKEKDSIGVAKDWFWLGKKQIAKYLVETGILAKNSFNPVRVEALLNETTSKPEHALEKMEYHRMLAQEIGHQVIRDKTHPVFVERLGIGLAMSKMTPRMVTQTRFKIFQGDNLDSKQAIGFAYIEKTKEERVRLVVTNIKDVPIAYFNNWKYFTFYPLTELQIDYRNIKKLGTPIEAIYQLCDVLIAQGKL